MNHVETGINDLKTKCPEIAKEWDYVKNAPLTPENVAYASGKKRWWICPLGHSYETTVDHRTKMHSGCPICSGRVALYGFNDLETTRPDLAAQWHPIKNGDLSPRNVTSCSGKRVWWICPQGHAYEAKVSDKNSHHSGCPICAFQNRTSKPEQAVFFYIKKYFSDAVNSYKAAWLGKREIDIFIPSANTAVEFDGKGWHEDITRDLEKSRLLKKQGIKIIRFREEGCPPIEDDSFQIPVPTNSMQIGRDSLAEGIQTLLAELDDSIDPDINIPRDYTQIMRMFADRKVKRSLESAYPEIAKEWHATKNGDLKPSNFTSASAERVWWQCCDCGYEWEMAISHRTTLDGKCPRCRGRYPVSGSNDLQTLLPEIAAEWDIQKNAPLLPSEVTTGNDTKVWWKCSKGHSYEAVIKDRTRRKLGCPYCSGKRACPGENDLLTLNPDVAKEWHPTRNKIKVDEVRPCSGKKVWWLCSTCGNEWQARIQDRTIKKSKCPACSRKHHKKRAKHNGPPDLII